MAEFAKLTDWLPILLEVMKEPPDAGFEAVAELPEQEAAVVALVAVAALPPIDRDPAVPVKPVPAPLNEEPDTAPLNVAVCQSVFRQQRLSFPLKCRL